MRLYRYFSEKRALQAIESERLKVSTISDLNDPFEQYWCVMQDPEDQRAFSKAMEVVLTMIGIICFTSKKDCPLMWAHYGDKHKGVCLGFDVVPNPEIGPVDYVDSLIDLRSDENGRLNISPEQFEKSFLGSKFVCWKYEEEIRERVDLSECVFDGHYFRPFKGNYQLREVILGLRSDLEISKVSATVQKFAGVTVTKASLDMARARLVTSP